MTEPRGRHGGAEQRIPGGLLNFRVERRRLYAAPQVRHGPVGFLPALLEAWPDLLRLAQR